MRLLYVCSDFGIAPSGTKGASIHLRAITRALSHLGHEVILLSPKDGPGEDHPAIPLLPDGGSAARRTSKSLKQWMNNHDLDDAVAKELRPLLYNASIVAPALEALGDDPPDAIIERLSLFGHVGLDLAEALNVPHIIEMNAPLVEEATRYRSLQLKALADQVERRVLQRADAVTVVSDDLARWLLAAGIAPERIQIIPNGADLDLFAATPDREECRRAFGLDHEFVIGFVGSLKEWHGVDLLLDAMLTLRRSMPDARLVIVGEGPARRRLHDQAETLGLADIATFTGAVCHEEIPRLLGAMDVAVAPFRTVPGFYFSPIKLFEYMAAGCCVVASRLGQIAEVVEDGVNGLLFSPESESDLCRALLHAAESRAIRNRLGATARRTIEQRFTWKHAGEALVGVIEAALEGRERQSKELLSGLG